MRSKAKYIKLIEKWTAELRLTGRLFVGKPILILLQGERRSIKVRLELQYSLRKAHQTKDQIRSNQIKLFIHIVVA